MYQFYFTDFSKSDCALRDNGHERLRKRPVNTSPDEIQAFVDFPEAQLLHGVDHSKIIAVTTKGLILCSSITAGFVSASGVKKSVFMSHTTPKMENDATESLVSAINIAEEDNYNLVYLATMGPRRAEYGQCYDTLKELVSAAAVGSSVKVLTYHYNNSTDWQLNSRGTTFSTTPFLL